jgi:hypothetical protein
VQTVPKLVAGRPPNHLLFTVSVGSMADWGDDDDAFLGELDV